MMMIKKHEPQQIAARLFVDSFSTGFGEIKRRDENSENRN
jgi:hypothetical protein